MPTTFAMLTRLGNEAVSSPAALENLEQGVVRHIESDCPNVKWLHNYALLGTWDYLDIFSAPDLEAALKVAMLVRVYGHAQTEVFGATEWDQYKEIIHEIQPEVVSAKHI